MKQNFRLQKIRDYLQDREELTVDEACELLQASPATVRRDFNELTGDGEIEKTWGGVTRRRSVDGMKPLFYRQTHSVAEKKAIARAAVALIRDGDVVMIDGGTTTLEMASLLVGKRVRIVTNSLLIANKIHLEQNGWPGSELFMTGGFLYPDSGLLVGPEATQTILQYHADWAFLSCGGIDAAGVTNSNQLVVETEKNMIRQSTRAVVLADGSKFGTRSMSKICDFGELTMIITNETARVPFAERIAAAGAELKKVEV